MKGICEIIKLIWIKSARLDLKCENSLARAIQAPSRQAKLVRRPHTSTMRKKCARNSGKTGQENPQRRSRFKRREFLKQRICMLKTVPTNNLQCLKRTWLRNLFLNRCNKDLSWIRYFPEASDKPNTNRCIRSSSRHSWPKYRELKYLYPPKTK